MSQHGIGVGIGRSNDVGGWWCSGCERYIVGAHACPGRGSALPRTIPPLSPFADRPGFYPHQLTEDDIRRIIREELKRAQAESHPGVQG